MRLVQLQGIAAAQALFLVRLYRVGDCLMVMDTHTAGAWVPAFAGTTDLG